PQFYKDLWDTVSDGRVWHGELVNRRKDGSFYTEEMRITPVRDARGRIVRFIAIKQDVTERRAAEEAKHFLASIVECSEDAIVVTTLEGRILTWNRGAQNLLGYTAAEVIGRHVNMLVAPEELQNVAPFSERILQAQTVSQTKGVLLRKDRSR